MGLAEGGHPALHPREGLGVVVQGPPDPHDAPRGAQGGQLGRRVAQLGLGRAVAGRAQPLLQRQRACRQRRWGQTLESPPLKGSDPFSGGLAGSAGSPRASRSSRADASAEGPCLRACASSTTPPPSVSGGAIRRTMSRSPSAATSGCSRRSWKRVSAERGHPRGRLPRAVVHLDPAGQLLGERRVRRPPRRSGAARCWGRRGHPPRRATSRTTNLPG